MPDFTCTTSPSSPVRRALNAVLLFLFLLLLPPFLPGCGQSAPTPSPSAPSPVADPPPAPVVTRHFVLPTPNQALLHSDTEEDYFVGTVGRPWPSGTFGCVRSEGWQVHEGLDIRAVQFDNRGEPADPIFATANGTIAYLNTNPALSSYGIYAILQHHIQGWELYSLYAHLSSLHEDLQPGQTIRAGQPFATMGRTANTQQRISKERAHLHFEIVLMINDQFQRWNQKTYPGQRNDHDLWNGRNFIGIDPRPLLLLQHHNPDQFDLTTLILQQTTLCRVRVNATDFSWLQRYPQFIEANPIVAGRDIAAYELHLNFNGLPFRIIPQAQAEIKNGPRFQLLDVNETEYARNPCRRLVRKQGAHWELAPAGHLRLDLLTYVPPSHQ